MMTEWNEETADWYAENYGEYPTNQAALVDLDLAPDLVLVDIGCGTGSALRFASKKITAGKLIGVDPVDRMLEIARDKITHHPAQDRIQFLKGSAEDLPIDDGIADLVLAFDSIDHWQDINQGLLGVQKILKRAGKFVIVKDLSVPGAKDQLADIRRRIIHSGFEIINDQVLTHQQITFVRWICRIA